MSLSDIDENYLSHPDYPYRYHIKNITDSFIDESHKNVAEFHDLGKLSKAFQTYIRNVNDRNQRKTTHSLESALIYLKEHKYLLDKNTLPEFVSILRRHGNLENIDDMAGNLNYTNDILESHENLIMALDEIQKASGLKNDFNLESCCDYFNEEPFVAGYKFSGIDMYYQIKEVFSKLIFADKYEAIFKQVYIEKPFNDFDVYIVKLLQLLAKKENNSSKIRNEARNDTLYRLKENLGKKIFLIEAPTGIGKTFMALHLALELGKEKKKKRIINALPMTSIIDQTYEEYLNIIDSDVLMKYHHLSVSKNYLTKDQESDSETNYSKQKNVYINKSWSEDKVIVTTFNQILNLFYSNKNSDLVKFWTLRDSVIIFDEIQAIPRILLKDFAETINYLSQAFNIDLILMSATVPDIKKHLDNSILCELLDNRYYNMEFNNRYAIKIDHSINCKERLVLEIEKEFENNQSVLCVVNTKKLALNVYQDLFHSVKKDDTVFLLSSLFIPKHRKDKINNIKTILKSKRKIILISTQVIEAGVDLDFDIGFREFAPFYSIIQTAGRINRENRSEVQDTAKLIVFPKIGYSPYHQTDLSEDIVFDLLKNEIRENNLLPVLRKYFEIVLNRTSPDPILYKKMENLEFEEVSKLLNNNFMKEIPGFTPIFIEIEKHLYNEYENSLKEIFIVLHEKNIPLEAKMNLKAQIKDIYKEISEYVINVPKKEANDLPYFHRDDEMKYCCFDVLNNYYSIECGWNTKDDFIF